MPGICREDDEDSSGDTPDEFSSDVKIEGKGVFRHGDKDSSNDEVTSGTALNSEAYKVFVNNKPVVLEGDKDTSNDTKNNASPTVSAGPS
jgi:uncharacterized Zn-binding protein involved in type VI secretion